MIRTFIAIELPKSLKTGLVELQTRLQKKAPPRAVRWVRPESIHLTIKFLGPTPETQVDDIIEDLESTCAFLSPFTYTVGGLGCFPNLRRPRVIWVGVQEPTETLSNLQRAIEDACAGLGFERERRAFHPHLTLGRLHNRASRGEQGAIGNFVQGLDQGALTEVASLGTMAAKGISLIRSDLRPTGAVYTTLGEIELKDRGVKPPIRD